MNGRGGTNDCIAYINKLVNMASNNPGQLFISASKSNCGNTNWYFDDTPAQYSFGYDAMIAVSNASPTSKIIYAWTNHIALATNVAGYFSGGYDRGLGGGFATNLSIIFVGNSGWYVMSTVDSYNGERSGDGFQSDFYSWFDSNAFGGNDHSNTPVGAIIHVDEPSFNTESRAVFFGDWAGGKSLSASAWDALYNGNGLNHYECAVVGDPFVKH